MSCVVVVQWVWIEERRKTVKKIKILAKGSKKENARMSPFKGHSVCQVINSIA